MIPWNKGLKGVQKSHRKGKTYEEIYGEERAKEMKQQLSIMNAGINHPHYGQPKSEETKRKIGLVHKGKIVSEKTREKLSKANKGRKTHSKEFKEYMRKRMSGKNNPMYGVKSPMSGKKHSEETRKKLSEYLKGKKHTMESRLKQSERMKGVPMSPKRKENIRNSLLGRKIYWKDKISISNLGQKRSEQSKKKMSNYWKDKRTLHESPNWQGGKSFEPYTFDFNDRFKKVIKKRDNFACQLCSMFENDHEQLYGFGLSIHHIDYNKKNSFPQNCITLCNKCNVSSNKDRELWTKHFQALLTKQYGYKYTQDQKIILDFMKDENEQDEKW